MCPAKMAIDLFKDHGIPAFRDSLTTIRLERDGFLLHSCKNGLFSNENNPFYTYIYIIPLPFLSYWHEYPLAFGSRFCCRHPPYQVLYPARQRDRTADVVGGKHQRGFGCHFFHPFAQEEVCTVIKLDCTEGVLRHPEALLQLIHIPLDIDHYPGGSTADSSKGMVMIRLYNVGDGLQSIPGASVHLHRHIFRLRPKLHRLECLPVRAAIGAGTAGFLTAIYNAVLLCSLKEHHLSHWAGNSAILMPDEAA